MIEIHNLPSKKTFTLMLTSLAAVIICIHLKTYAFPLSLPGMLVSVFELFFHELGHTIFGFLFGMPSIPVLVVTWHSERSWTLQIIMYFVMAGGCFWLWRNSSTEVFIVGLIFTIAIIIMSFTKYYDLLVSFMGHGGSMAAGAYIVYRGWLLNNYPKPTNHWLIGFVGYSCILWNMFLSYKLIDDMDFRVQYGEKTIFGIHNDFTTIMAEVPELFVERLASIIICMGIVALIGSFAMAVCSMRYSKEY